MDTNNTLTPVKQSQRIAIVDILRAYALLGVVIINYTGFQGWDSSHGNSIDTVLGFISTYVFFRKSALLLSVLFGYGFSVLINNLQKKNYNVPPFFIKRMFWLFVIAFVNSCFFGGDILKSYAVLGVILLLFYRSSTKTILASAIILLIFIPFSSGYTLFALSNKVVENSDNQYLLFLSHHFFDVINYDLNESYVVQSTWLFYAISVQHFMLCCFLWGMYIQRIHFFENLADNKKYIKRIFWFSIPAFALSTVITMAAQKNSFLLKYCNFFIISFLCGMLFFTAAIMWLYVSGKLKGIFNAMQYYGKMTLTNYIMQDFIAFFLFSGVGLSIGKSYPYWLYFTVSIVVFIAQIFISKYWLKRFNYGPLEWLWRELSYGRRLFMKKNKPVTNEIKLKPI